VLQIPKFRCCPKNPSCTRSRESAPIVLVCTVLHQHQIETSVTFCGMVWLRTVVLGRMGALIFAIQERVLYPAHRSPFTGRVSATPSPHSCI